MKKGFYWCFTLSFVWLLQTSYAQQSTFNSNIVNDAWVGNIEYRAAQVWVEVDKNVRDIALFYADNNFPKLIKKVANTQSLGNDFNPLKFTIGGLEPNTTYTYWFIINGKKYIPKYKHTFKTKLLWNWRIPPPNFSFLCGSCNYVNDSAYDRPGKPYGATDSIFETMANTPADFHIWMGDNWYTREVDYSSVWGLYYRASHDRHSPHIQKLMAAMPQYAIWDDHDFGPNDFGTEYILKDSSRAVFNSYFLNPTSGQNNKGIYTMFNYSDADFFLLDDRFFRSAEEMLDSVDGKPNKHKQFLGSTQLSWLQNALTTSKATFKIIVVGSQVLNQYNEFETYNHYTNEKNELLNFIAAQRIKGVIFFSGDRHHSEIIKVNRANTYPLYDITISPYTSGIAKVRGAELNNADRIEGSLVETYNFGKVSIEGEPKNRKMRIEFINKDGLTLFTYTIPEKELGW